MVAKNCFLHKSSNFYNVSIIGGISELSKLFFSFEFPPHNGRHSVHDPPPVLLPLLGGQQGLLLLLPQLVARLHPSLPLPLLPHRHGPGSAPPSSPIASLTAVYRDISRKTGMWYVKCIKSCDVPFLQSLVSFETQNLCLGFVQLSKRVRRWQ